MTIPQEALARIEARLQSLRPGRGQKLLLELNAYCHKDETLRVEFQMDGEKVGHTVLKFRKKDLLLP